MELQEFVRKPFPVQAVQVDFANAYEVAEWCKGSVVLKKTRLMGGAGKGEMDLPTVVFKGTGDYRDKEFTAGLGDWVVELRGNFRVFKKAQFKATFEPVKEEPILHEITEKFPDAVRASTVTATVDGEKTLVCTEHGTTVEDCVKQHELQEDNSSIDGQETVHVSL